MSEFIQNKINNFTRLTPNMSPEQAKNFLENKLIPELSDLIIKAENSGLNLNEYFKTLL
ncbi:hypothetical protein [uncultured Tenacibaculum sp.]|uniref:hypothetical protein n=1 Tax=uncultured Tenacibaculum sp. TaxID=174713 RepID=UPI002607A751|nr:hypothetical protein [uncultured Tenacibaculum sp.]